MVRTRLTVDNQTTKDITKITVDEVRDFDFWKDYGTPLNFNGKGLKAKSFDTSLVETNAHATNCPFHMVLTFEDSSVDSFKIRQKFVQPDVNNILPKETKSGISNLQNYCICDQKYLDEDYELVELDGFCPHLEVRKRTHNILFKRVSNPAYEHDGTLKITVSNTDEMNVLEKALEEDKKANKHYNNTNKKDLEKAANAERAAIKYLEGIKEHEELRQHYQTKLANIEAEQNADSSAPDTLEEMNKLIKAVTKGMDDEKSKAGQFKHPTEAVLNQLQIKTEALKYTEYAKAAMKKAEESVKSLTQKTQVHYSDIKDIADMYEEAKKLFGKGLDYFYRYSSISQNKNKTIKHNENLLGEVTSTLKEVKRMLFVFAVQEIGLDVLENRPRFNGEEWVEINAETQISRF